MIEIKLRAWDGENIFYLKDGYHLIFWDDPKRVKYGLYSNEDDTLIDKEDRGLIIMLFTGLKDSNKNDIYESDIIECEYYDELPTTEGEPLIWRGVVEWSYDASFHVVRKDKHKQGGCYSVGYGGSAIKRWEVIGNIYENPELIK
jgi:uncharacterized phage protein (TIGR01671 family)